MNWYNDWFNSKFYLKVYSHRDDTEAERLVNLIIKELELPSGTKVLDMACGSGRHAIIFARKGFDVTAVDLSKLLISEAEKNADENNVQIKFVLSDILKFQTECRYKIVLNLFTSFGYFDNDEENFQVIKKAYDLIEDGGFFVLDYFNKNFLMKNLIPTTVFSENSYRITQNRMISGNRVQKNITIENKDSVVEFYESVRVYNYEEISEFISKAGFKKDFNYGDYDGNRFNLDSSPRLILFARK